MAALTANREVDRYVDQEIREYPVEGGAHIYKGAFVGMSASGHAQGLVATNVFLGIACEEVDNTGLADGAKKVRVLSRGDFKEALSGVGQTKVGANVYASDDQTLTLTSTSNSLVGKVAAMPAANEIILRIEPFNPAI